MSRTENFDNSFWDEPDVLDLGPEATYVYIWSWTNRRCDLCGIYKVALASISLETKLDQDKIQGALVELEQARFLFYDGTWMFVRTRVKKIESSSIYLCKNIAKDLSKVPSSHPYLLQLLEVEGDRVWQNFNKKEKTTQRLTIREALYTIRGGSEEGLQYYSLNGSGTGRSDTLHGASGDVPMTGTGTGTETSQGRGAGRGFAAELVAAFPEHEPWLVKNTAREIHAAGEIVTIDAVRARLVEVAA